MTKKRIGEPRSNHIAVALVILLSFTALTLRAEDFWAKKDWTQWSDDDCKQMMTASPWSKPGTSANAIFLVQLYSSQPVRDAIIRQLRIRQHYDQMSDEEKKRFDERANPVLNQDFTRFIVVRVDYAAAPHVSQKFLSDISENASECKACRLITEQQEEIPAVRFVNSPDARKFELYFPRIRNGEPIIKPDAKIFTIQFEQCTVENPSTRMRVFFSTVAMKWKGNLSY
jgi:hypothetical protein